MRLIRTKGDLHHAVAEPGDATRYDFYMLKLGEYIYCFSDNDDMAYPKRLHMDMDLEVSVTDRKFSQRAMRLARQHNVNVNTFNQVMVACELAGYECT